MLLQINIYSFKYQELTIFFIKNTVSLSLKLKDYIMFELTDLLLFKIFFL